MSNQGTVYQLDPTNSKLPTKLVRIYGVAEFSGSVLTIGSQSNTGNMSGFSSKPVPLYICRAIEGSSNPSKLRRNASAMSDMSSISSQCAPTNTGYTSALFISSCFPSQKNKEK